MACSTALLKHLAAHGGRWQLKGNVLSYAAPSSASTSQALLQLLLRLTRRHANAVQVRTGGFGAWHRPLC